MSPAFLFPMNQSAEITIPKAIKNAVEFDIIPVAIQQQIEKILIQIQKRRNAIQDLLDKKKAQFTENEKALLQQISATVRSLKRIDEMLNVRMNEKRIQNMFAKLFPSELKRSDTQILQNTLQFKANLSDLEDTMETLHAQLQAQTDITNS